MAAQLPDDRGTVVERLRLTKHEGTGNDFLVALDAEGRLELSPGEIRTLCDRHRGVGADGLIVVRPGSATELEMLLWNADGSRAEVSGNGLRCLAQAAVEARLVQRRRFRVHTGAGVRSVDYQPGPRRGVGSACVGMGEVVLGAALTDEHTGRPARQASIGNPHLVVLFDHPGELAIEELGPKIEAAQPGGLNVELIAPRPGARGELVLAVWERGVGLTLACGTGSCAAAAAARAWGLVGDEVRVHNPGGVLDVRLGPGEPAAATLSGAVRKVADIELDRPVLT